MLSVTQLYSGFNLRDPVRWLYEKSIVLKIQESPSNDDAARRKVLHVH